MFGPFLFDFLHNMNGENEISKTRTDLMKEKTEFENLIFECTPKSIQKATNLLFNFNIKWVYSFLCYVYNHRLFSCTNLHPLFNIIREKFNDESFYIPSFVLRYPKVFKSQENIEKRDSSYELIFNEVHNQYDFDENSIWHFVKVDDLQHFTELVTRQNIDIKREWIGINDIFFRILSMALYCGSFEIVKYLLINGTKLSNDSISWAVKGGSEQIIEFLASQGYSLNDNLGYAVQYHHNSIAIWLYENFHDDFFSIPYCVQFFNSEFLFFLLEDKSYINRASLFEDIIETIDISQKIEDIISLQYLEMKRDHIFPEKNPYF